MAERPLLAWDVGGVLLSNAWDAGERTRAAEEFGFDPTDFERRHRRYVPGLERGTLSLNDYLSRTVFARRRGFGRAKFLRFLFALSTPNHDTLALARKIQAIGTHRQVVLNNESRELNAERIERFRLAETFDFFFTSCYTGLLKPDPAAFRFLLDVSRQAPRDVVFVDDRPKNIAAALGLGIRAIRYEDPVQLRRELKRVGVDV